MDERSCIVSRPRPGPLAHGRRADPRRDRPLLLVRAQDPAGRASGRGDGVSDDQCGSRCPTAACGRSPPGTTARAVAEGIGSRARAGRGRRAGGRRGLGSRPADRARRRPGDPHRPGSRGARGPAALRGPRARHRGAGALPRRRGSASARRSKTASTTTSRCRARSRPRTWSGSRAGWAQVVQADYPFVREVVDRDAANRRFADDPLKLERIDELGDDETITVYTDGPFIDLCRGPHVPRHRPAQALQAAARRRRLLAGRREAADAPADLRHRLVQEGRPRRLPPPAGGGPQARPPRARAPARPVLHLGRRRARAGALAPAGRHDQVAPLPGGRGRQRRQRVRPGLHAQRHQGRAVQDLRPPAALRRQPVPGHGRRSG